MNKNNIAILAFIVLLAAGISYWAGNALLGSKTLKPVTVKTAQPINPEIQKPESTVFYPDAINPTIPIAIGDNNNQSPIGQ